MREFNVETYLVDQVKLFGGDSQKHISPGRNGVVDRIVIPPLGLPVWFVELKRPTGELEGLQRYERDRLIRLGQRVAALYTKAHVDAFVAARRAEIHHEATRMANAARSMLREMETRR